MPRLMTGTRVHLRHSMEPVNGTIVSSDWRGFTVRWDAAPDRRKGARRGGKYYYPRSQAGSFGLGLRRGED